MTKLTNSKSNPAGAAKAALAATLLLGAALALSGCEQHPYPTPAPDDSAAQPAPPSQLMGAPNTPNTPDGQPAMGPAGPDGAPPPGYDGPSGAPTPYPQGAPLRAPCPPSALPHGPGAPTVIICSAPVPNPVEDGAYPRHHRHHVHGHLSPDYQQGYAGSAPSRLPPYPRHYRHDLGSPTVEHGHTSGYVFHNGHRYRIEGPAHLHAGHPGLLGRRRTHLHIGPLVTPPVLHHAHPLIAKPVPEAPKPTPLPHVKPVPAPAAVVAPAANVTASNTMSNTTDTTTNDANTTGNTTAATAAAGTPAQRYAALTSALATVIAREATLNLPTHFVPGQAADVTLNVPSDFAQTLRQEAVKQDLSDQTTSVNLTSALTGDGYAVTPIEPQSQPLTLGEQTVFHWKVTAQPNAKGPLQASLHADILSDGQSLPLGPVKVAEGEHWTGRVVGVGLLVLIALILLGWAAQRKRPAASGASKPRDNHTNSI